MNRSTLTKKHADLKKCNKLYGIITAVYIISCGAYILASLYFILLPFDLSPLYLFLNGPVFKGAVLVLGFLGAYKKKDLFAGAAPLIMFFDMIIFWNADNQFDGFWGAVLGIKINAVFFTATVALAVLNVIVNAKYRYLEQQEGFPQFSEVFEQQKKGKPEYGLTFEERAEQLRKTARSDMEEI